MNKGSGVALKGPEDHKGNLLCYYSTDLRNAEVNFLTGIIVYGICSNIFPNRILLFLVKYK